MANKTTNIVVKDPSLLTGALKRISGSRSDDWSNNLASQLVQSLWANPDKDEREKQFRAVIDALIGIAPKDELEGMAAVQLIACHNATMECFRRAMIGEQTFDGRRENLSQANKLSRTYAAVLETLNRHRGKGAQTVRVEHVTVNAGGQAIVGNLETPGGGVRTKLEDQPYALGYAPGEALRSANAERKAVPVAGDA